ncbi:tetratricopeptide repeat protein [Amycolatopsis viridis]|uniref:Tfp pilus assembly protein PilF n=1 Tax=Amycolatopsis viridis TaxID=185678 RepID=A0ABX0SZU3_9PSEU|nr:tetratricopeptide repeat protein [Amycolatopsis viridis]NIH80840.1 Tfp pilus assembly protein PilF [Amycolatopsis viridis]
MHQGEPLTRRGTELRDEDLHEEAIEVLREAVAAGEPSAPRELAYALLGGARPRDALAVLKAAIGRGRVDLCTVLGSLATELGDYPAAHEAYRKAMDHGDLSALNDYGLLLCDEGNLDEAIAIFRRAAEFGDELAPGNLIALYVEDLNDLAAARDVGERYLSPRYPGVYPALGDVYANLGKLAKADALFRDGVRLGAPRVHQKYGWFLWKHRGDIEAAEREFWAAFDDDEVGWSHALGRFLLSRNRVDEARAVLERGAVWGDVDARELLDELES